MRQLIKKFLILVILAPQLAWSFTDEATMMGIEVAKQEINQSEHFAVRMKALLALNDLVQERLVTIDASDFDVLPYNHPRIENYRSLTEFKGYLQSVVGQRSNVQDCPVLKSRIINASKGGVYAEGKIALDLLEAACRK